MNRWLDFLIGIPLMRLLPLFFRPRPRSQSGVKKILVIKMAAVGDTILLMPVLKSFRKKHPDWEIHWLVTPINRAVAGLVADVDRIVTWNRKLGAGFWKMLSGLRSEKYDVVVDLEQWSRGSAIISFLTGAAERLGFDTPGQFRTPLFTGTYKKEFRQHEIKDFFGLMSLLGPLDESEPLTLPVSDQGRAELNAIRPFLNLNKSGAPNVILHPGCGDDGLPREWPLIHYGVLAHWLRKKYDARLIITSGPEETKKSADLLRLINGKGVDMGGRLSWQGLIALVNEVDMVVSGNTGIMHIAAALGKKQVALHGPTSAVIWGPLNDHARIVKTTCPDCPSLKLGFEYHRRDPSCMNRIELEKVKDAVEGLFDKGPKILIEDKNNAVN